MSTNRLEALFSMGEPCSCCEAERRARHWQRVGEEIEIAINGGERLDDDTDGLVRVIAPCRSTFIDEEFDVCLEFYPGQAILIAPATTLAGIETHVAGELRRIAALCIEAAGRMEGGAE